MMWTELSNNRKFEFEHVPSNELINQPEGTVLHPKIHLVPSTDRKKELIQQGSFVV